MSGMVRRYANLVMQAITNSLVFHAFYQVKFWKLHSIFTLYEIHFLYGIVGQLKWKIKMKMSSLTFCIILEEIRTFMTWKKWKWSAENQICRV